MNLRKDHYRLAFSLPSTVHRQHARSVVWSGLGGPPGCGYCRGVEVKVGANLVSPRPRFSLIIFYPFEC